MSVTKCLSDMTVKVQTVKDVRCSQRQTTPKQGFACFADLFWAQVTGGGCVSNYRRICTS